MNDPRSESMVFNYETTVRNDFRNGSIFDFTRTLYKEKPKSVKVNPPSLKNIETLTFWKNSSVPTELLVKPKEVVRTDPRKIQQAYAPLEDVDKDRVRSTRPRLVMTPAVSMDDIDDEKKRQILTKEMYASSNQMAMEMGIKSIHLIQPVTVKAPLQGSMSPANPIKIKKLQFAYVAPQWRMQSVSWDGRQLRAHTDPSKEFYLASPIRCKICDVTAAKQKERKMLCLQSKRNM